MSYRRPELQSGTGRIDGGRPWLFFVFLAIMFFLCYRDLSIDPRGREDVVNPPQDYFAGSVNGSPVTHIAQLLLGVAGILIVVRYRNMDANRIGGSVGVALIAFIGWAFLSCLWAENVGLTVQRLTGFGILCIAASAVVRRLSLREIGFWTFFSTALFLLVGILAETWFGTFHPFVSGYRFAGSLGPNDQGVECGILVLSAVATADAEGRRRMLYISVGVLGLVFLFITGSRTAIAATLVTVVLYEGVVRSRRSKVLLAVALSILSCTAVVVVAAPTPEIKHSLLVGRDDPDNIDSLAGRIQIWQDVESYIRQRPILGYGYGGFWTPTRIRAISDEENHGVPNGHSTYIDYFLTLGFVGLFAYSLLLLTGIRVAFRNYGRTRDPMFAFCGSFFLFCALHGLLESGSAERGILKFVSIILFFRLAMVPAPTRSYSQQRARKGPGLAGQKRPVRPASLGPEFH